MRRHILAQVRGEQQQTKSSGRPSGPAGGEMMVEQYLFVGRHVVFSIMDALAGVCRLSS